MKEIEKETIEKHHVHGLKELIFFKCPYNPKHYAFHSIHIKMPKTFFIEIKSTPKTFLGLQRPRIVNIILSKNKEARGTTISVLKTYCSSVW
jgi:hypothetical protein